MEYCAVCGQPMRRGWCAQHPDAPKPKAKKAKKKAAKKKK